MSRRAIRRAYEVTGALGRPCPHCHVEAGVPCIRVADDGTQYHRKVPCLARVQRPLDADVTEDVARDVTRDNGFAEPPQELDFSQPRHPHTCQGCDAALDRTNTGQLCAECQLIERNSQ